MGAGAVSVGRRNRKIEVSEETESRNILVWEKFSCLSEVQNSRLEGVGGLEDWFSYWKEVESCRRIVGLSNT